MYSSYEVKGYVFDTVALRDALGEIEYDYTEEGRRYSPESLRCLLNCFCDWGPNTAGLSNTYEYVNTSPYEGIQSLPSEEKEAHYEVFCEELSNKLNEQYSLDVSGDDIRCLSHAIVNDATRDTQYDFFLRYLARFSEHLDNLDPRGGGRDIQEFLDRTRSLHSDYLDTKRKQYSGSDKINKIRFRLLERFEQKGDVSPEELKQIKRSVSEESDKDILRAYRDYTILGQIYYDFFKLRIDHYLENVSERLVKEFSDIELTYHVSNFQAPRNRLGTHAWISLHTPPKGKQADKHQLYLGIHPDKVTIGLHVGGDRREGNWEENLDLTEIEPSEINLGRVIEKFRDVEDEFRVLEGLSQKEEEVFEKPGRADEIARQLDSKKQVIFYGPPGTGKTYVAQNFAKWWTSQQDVGSPSQERVQTVTFHPSFTYEDFIEGLSAESDESGAVEYGIEDGILKRISKKARDDYNATENGEEAPRYVLIVDEINRGNIAQIFGETITLLEKDKRGTVSTRLAHSDEPFTVPPNLYIIGTMNTADRSISLVDAALRRRFRFLPFPPNLDELSKHHEMEGMEEVVETASQSENDYDVLMSLSIIALKQTNEEILSSPDLGKGKQIGHSYLMDVDGTQELVDTWKYDILPLLEEYYFGQFDRIRQDIFRGGGSALVDWESERVRDFDANDLLETLKELVDLDVSVNEIKEQSTSDSGSSESYSNYPEALGEAQEKIYPRVKDTLNAEDVGDVSYEDTNRRKMAFWSQDPNHPSKSEILYIFKPEPERNGRHLVALHTLRDDDTLFEFITQNSEVYEQEGFLVTPSHDSNKRYNVVRKEYEIEEVDRGEGKEIVDELVESEDFERSVEDFVDLVEITHELIHESDSIEKRRN